MRMLLHASIPVKKGNEAFDNGELQRAVQHAMETLKPEAAYFFADRNGNRSSAFIFDMEGSWQLPAIVEPLFHSLEATVHVTPVMTGEDLQRGMQEMSGA